jgi:murein L,D-transpeptidase YcbB/YkuD
LPDGVATLSRAARSAASLPLLWLVLVGNLLTSLPATAAPASSAAAWLAGDQAARLEAELLRYELIRDIGGWEPLPVSARLQPGARDPLVPRLRARLRATADLSGEMGADPLRFDAALVEAVAAFQQRLGLAATGRLDRQTIDALNVPVERRLAQLTQALDAWRQLGPPAGGGDRVWVNVPEAEVAGLRSGAVDLRMRAVVGHPSRPTPELSSAITRVIVNPAWSVPPRIAAQDLLPRQRANNDFFSARGIRVFQGWSATATEVDPRTVRWETVDPGRFPYHLRQDPGPANSLGRYKFDFANSYDVYLHDTPSTLLLDLSVRTLSSGCVRLADAATFATWLAAGDAPAIRQYASATELATRAFALPAAVPIDIVYLSAWVDPATGSLQFRRDVYERAAAYTERVAAAVSRRAYAGEVPAGRTAIPR